MTEGRKNIAEQGSKVKKTSMTKGRKNIAEQRSKIKNRRSKSKALNGI
jgi:hypothetical protein